MSGDIGKFKQIKLIIQRSIDYELPGIWGGQEFQGRHSGTKLNFWPPMEASAISPPFAIVNTATPLL